MRFRDRPKTYQPQFGGSPFGRHFSGLLPWMFVVGIVLAVVLTFRHGMGWLVPQTDGERTGDAEIVLQQAGHPGAREPVDVIRTIDGDTFLARAENTYRSSCSAREARLPRTSCEARAHGCTSDTAWRPEVPWRHRNRIVRISFEVCPREPATACIRAVRSAPEHDLGCARAKAAWDDAIRPSTSRM